MKHLAWVALAVGCTSTSPSMSQDLAGELGDGALDTDAAADLAPVRVQLAGAVQKGPFVLGSTIQLSTVDLAGNPTGQVFPTQTSDDLGDFSLTFTYQGNALIEGSGFYWNEATGQLSNASLTLRAFYSVTANGSQSAYVNIVTHLTHDRIKVLLAATPPPPLSDAVTQAETELRAALGLGGPGFDPKAAGVEMNVSGGDTDANAYLFALSAILAEIAKSQAGTGSIDAALQQLINTVSSSFATTGQISASLKQEIAALQEAANPLNTTPPTIDPQALMDSLAARLAQVGSTATVPNLNRVWDSDGDGVPNATDNCPLLYNPDQKPVDGICRLKFASQPINGAAALADFNHDGKIDILGWNRSVDDRSPNDTYVLLGDGSGTFATTVSTPGSMTNTMLVNPNATASASGNMTSFFPWVGDVDKDGKLDLVGEAGRVVAGDSYQGYTAMLPGDNAGHFSAGLQMTSTDVGSQPFSSWPYVLHQIVISDFNSDGLNDWVATSYDDTVVWVGYGQTSRLWQAPVQIPVADKVLVRGLVTADFNKDGHPDIAFASHGGTYGPNTFVSGIYVLLGTGASPAPFASPSPSPITSITGLTGLYTADVNADGNVDLIVGSADVTILLGDGAGHFASVTAALGAGTTADSTVWIYLGDYTGDGKLDLLTWSPNLPIRLFVGNGTTFPTSTPIWVPGFAATTLQFATASVIGGADLNADGVQDFVASVYGTSGPLLTTVLINAK